MVWGGDHEHGTHHGQSDARTVQLANSPVIQDYIFFSLCQGYGLSQALWSSSKLILHSVNPLP